ncbi:MAG: DUF4384 domain-containing protein [Burkholderiaceae bacterium]
MLTFICAFLPFALHAATATLASDADLRTEHYADAAVLSRLAKGTSVETLQLEAGWIQVRTGSRVGWVRASQLTATGAYAPPKTAEDGRNGPNNVMAISGIRSMPRASNHAAEALAEIHAQRDTNRSVSVTLPHPALSIGKDALDLSVTSSHDGYLYLIVLGSDNKSFYMLFPNNLDQDNAIQAGKVLKLPRKKWEIKAQGPSGTDKLLAIVTESPRNLSETGKTKAGPFLTIPTDADGRPDLHWLSGISSNPASTQCRSDERQRNRDIENKCTATFSAMLIDIVEK